MNRERCRELLHYNPDTGLFTWRKKVAKKISIGDKAGYVNNKGYIRIGIDGKEYQAHRIAWLIHYGSFPDGHLDHINGDQIDNRITNLRQATRAMNMRNMKRNCNNTSGINGVYWNKSHQKWYARAYVDNKPIFIGRFVTLLAAAYARHAFNIDNGFTARHGL